METMDVPYCMPTRVKRTSPKQTDIEWNDGHSSSYPSWYLREKCPCALCVDEFSGERRIAPGSISSGIERVDVKLVGNYGLQFRWSDKHETGIYTFDYLRRICPCPECLPEGLSEPRNETSPPGIFEV